MKFWYLLGIILLVVAFSATSSSLGNDEVRALYDGHEEAGVADKIALFGGLALVGLVVAAGIGSLFKRRKRSP